MAARHCAPARACATHIRAGIQPAARPPAIIPPPRYPDTMRRALTALAPILATSLAPSPALAEAPVPFPNPVISEVLFSVPADESLDPNKDGVRDATSDEFVEIMNPHDKPIDLKGFVITDKSGADNPANKRGVRFVFPTATLPPGAVALLFNGAAPGRSIPGPVGNAARAAAPNPNFAGALVFSLENSAPSRAFANSADLVALLDPDGKPIDVVLWGRNPPAPPAGALRVSTVRAASIGSVQRPTPDAEFLPHAEIDANPCSPGLIPPSGAQSGAPSR